MRKISTERPCHILFQSSLRVFEGKSIGEGYPEDAEKASQHDLPIIISRTCNENGLVVSCESIVHIRCAHEPGALLFRQYSLVL